MYTINQDKYKHEDEDVCKKNKSLLFLLVRQNKENKESIYILNLKMPNALANNVKTIEVDTGFYSLHPRPDREIAPLLCHPINDRMNYLLMGVTKGNFNVVLN